MRRNKLFNKIFDDSEPNNRELIELLISEINYSESNLKDNLNQIREDFPNLTDHSIEHSLMLWNYAEIIIGENITINVIEAYVLHMCFLIHDSGMCYSILNNKAEIENTDLYKDFISLNKNRFQDVEYEALFYCVRKMHGDFALEIINKKLPTGKDIIENRNLRDEFADIIGKISKSHSCDVSYIENELNTYVSPRYIDFPIDCKKLAFILRVSDAANIDNLRTPLPKDEIEIQNEGISKEHWRFQKKLGFPTIENNYLVYRSNSPFDIKENRAWWLCYDALNTLNSEIIKANTFFTINNMPELASQGVVGVGNPLELGQKYILTKDWHSINTNIKVTNPKLLASNIGGTALYGKTFYAIRELIQNSIDAISIRQIKEKNHNGFISITLTKKDDIFYLSIRDNGIGMSRNVLINQLLDFGSSYWKSSNFYDEYIGIAQKQFNSIGKFGIGFYSVFMLGENVSIKTVKFGESLKEQYILNFDKGLFEDPLLSKVKEGEFLNDYGTEITIKLLENPYDGIGFIKDSHFQSNNLIDLIKFLIPSCKYVFEINELGKISTYSNFIDNNKPYTFSEIMDIVHILRTHENDMLIERIRNLKLNLIPIKYNDICYGQLGILPSITKIPTNEFALVMCQGIRVNNFSEQNFIGYLNADDVINLNRNNYTINIPYEVLYEWAVKQIEYMTNAKGVDYSEAIKSLKFAYKLFDNNDNSYWFYINTNNTLLPVLGNVDENFIINYLKSNEKFTLYTLDNTEHLRDYKYDGFVSLVRLYTLQSIINPNDKNKILTSASYLHNLFNLYWGGFDENIISGFSTWSIDYEHNKMPFLNMQIFTKPRLS